MLYNTEGIVIRSIAYGETHAIVTLLTPTGTVAAMARGAKKPQSRLAAGVQLCTQGLYTIYQRSGMGNIQQLEVMQTRRSLREKLELAAYAAYFCELVTAAAEERPNGSAAVYNLFVGALDRLSTPEQPAAVTARVWEAKILKILGASPDWTDCVRCGDEVGGSVSYSSRDGGFVCQNCQAEAPFEAMFRVPDMTPRVLHMMTLVPWQKLGQVSLSDRTTAALNVVLRSQMMDFAGLSLKSRTVLDSLGV